MLEKLKKIIDNQVSEQQLRTEIVGLNDSEKNIVESYFNYKNGNYGAAALAYDKAANTIPMDKLLEDSSIMFSAGDFCLGALCESSVDGVDGIIACCGLPCCTFACIMICCGQGGMESVMECTCGSCEDSCC